MQLCRGSYYGGIPVPGRRVPALRFFEYYVSSCSPSSKGDSFSLDQLSQLIQKSDAEQIAEKLQRNLYFAVDDVDVQKLMGRWYTVVDTPSVHPDKCVVTEFTDLSSNRYTSTFTGEQKGIHFDGAVRTWYGNGRKVGPDPGSLFIHTGHPVDVCPYFPVKVGPVNAKGEYEYLVLTQALKYPTVVMARDPARFEQVHRPEVREYLDKFGFMNLLASASSPLMFVNASSCHDIASQYY
ncbi:LPR-1 protein [Aphelenchoides avenae]|nr:LPR-1 protein [Aphelenchus avenae]